MLLWYTSSMKTIKSEIIDEQIIQKSKFITHLIPVSSEEQAKTRLSEIKKQHPKAHHHCTALVIEDIVRSNDDGEPASSAGLPMLQMLQAHDLNYVLAVVIRYFGGIKLGVGGLIRAYSSSVQQAIEQAALFEKTIVYQVMVEIDFDQLSIIETQLNNQAEIKERFYSDKAGFELEVYDLTLLDKLYDLSNGRLIIVDQQPVEKWIEMKKSL